LSEIFKEVTETKGCYNEQNGCENTARVQEFPVFANAHVYARVVKYSNDAIHE
jgi:hypothetical protein